VIKKRGEGDGGILGRELLTALEKAIKKFS